MSSYPTPELFRCFPELRERLPWVALARPTPVERLKRLESHLHAAPIWVKRDDRTSDVFGGDKARKFEFVFGDLLRRGARRVVAFGPVGSGHCLAVAAFAHHFHLRPVLALVRQAQSRNVLCSLEIEHELGAELHRLDAGPRAVLRFLRSLVAGRRDEDEPRLPYVIWPRRLALLGALGYANAALELRRQINVGILPEPQRIYVPVRSGASAAGLLLGCHLAKVQATIVGVVAAGRPGQQPLALARRAASALGRRTRRFHAVALRRGALELRREFAAGGGLGTSSAHHTAGLLRDLESLDLDVTYGARAMAALVQDVRTGRAAGPVLLWHANPAGIFNRETRISAEALPRDFREFFVAR